VVILAIGVPLLFTVLTEPPPKYEGRLTVVTVSPARIEKEKIRKSSKVFMCLKVIPLTATNGIEA
jgi:hypothetical protein